MRSTGRVLAFPSSWPCDVLTPVPRASIELIKVDIEWAHCIGDTFVAPNEGLCSTPGVVGHRAIDIRTVLERDVVLLRDLFDRLEASENASERTLRLLVSSGAPPDSLAQALYEARTWIVLSVNRGPYDALKSTGIDKVSDDAVRSALVGMYEYRLPRVHSFLDSLTGLFHSLDDLSEVLYTPVVETGEDGTLHVARKLTANGELLLATVPALVERRTSAVREARRRLTPLLSEGEHLLQLLAQELEGTPDRARADR